ncbi:type I phosphodiesterase / nucleotide pyrophosphatase family protein [Lyngbya aestuarii BL J]|uniref:Type I phosphodiesterase / nucleotide pyrophosphatase family protein n=1 Tax=Lyngbya aestuarii BL J TaxID=1348334 RepID=U7QMR4_9CYAN|nr:nucleotide pyrophosphatase/phosphodiesterase family protein [Lyngbya aestuarii]ERT08562.1 type I phosphodiesterase / nucleotide pyrophosphatase family protein [Lyngbya aestuarii BL J]
MQKTVVINIVGLTSALLKAMPNLSKWAKQVNTIKPVLPAVTCSAQTTYLTGKWPSEHGIVGNGWYFRDENEIKFWRQSNRLVQAPKIWEMAKEITPNCTTANLFWWYNMNSSVDYGITPRPMYPADGRKIPDIYTQPGDLRSQIQSDLGQFPLFKFWGPATSIASSQWIADSAKWVDLRQDPTLTLIYLPHLDYCLQSVGTKPEEIQKDLQAIDQVCADLIDYYTAKNAKIVVLSEYGITPVSQPIHLNRLLREKGLLSVREELGLELLDMGASEAFAVADHQIAHIYVRSDANISKVRSILENVDGIDYILDKEDQKAFHLNHSRSGDLVAIADPHAWFTYYYWLDDKRAPDFARTVDIHRKPGFDPVELFIDPKIPLPKLKIASTLLRKQLGFRYLLDVIPLDANLVKGSHGCIPPNTCDHPVFITQKAEPSEENPLLPTDISQLILKEIFN